MNATEMINHLNSRLDALKVENDRLKAANAELVNELEYAAEIIEQERGEGSTPAICARAAIAKHKEQSK